MINSEEDVNFVLNQIIENLRSDEMTNRHFKNSQTLQFDKNQESTIIDNILRCEIGQNNNSIDFNEYQEDKNVKFKNQPEISADSQINESNPEEQETTDTSGFSDSFIKNLSPNNIREPTGALSYDKTKDDSFHLIMSTPNDDCEKNSILFDSCLENSLKQNTNNSSSVDNGMDNFDKAFDEAFNKYSNCDKEFADASVQTHEFQCLCRMDSGKDGELRPNMSESVAAKRFKMDDEYSFVSYRKVSSSEEAKPQGAEDNSIEKTSSNEVNGENIVTILKGATRIRLGLSKRAKPQPLLTKLIY